jgi:hypothetical protein
LVFEEKTFVGARHTLALEHLASGNYWVEIRENNQADAVQLRFTKE